MVSLQCAHAQMLYLQVRKILGVLIVLARGEVPDEYISVALDENCVVPVPAAPAHLCYLAECEYTPPPKLIFSLSAVCDLVYDTRTITWRDARTYMGQVGA